MNQAIDRTTLTAIVNILTPYVTVHYENLLGALLASDLDITALRAHVKNQAHAGNAALVALIEHSLAKQVDFIHPNWTEQTIISIEKRTASSGNITWKCELLNREKPLYIRQQNKALFTAHYPQIEDLALNAAISAEIKCYTSPDGDFLKLEKVIPNGLFAYKKVTATEIANDNTKRQAEALAELGDLTHAVFCDFETTGTGGNAEIVQYGIVSRDYGTSEHFHARIKPEEPELLTIPGKYGKTAQSIHGITAAILANEKPFPEHYADIKNLIHGKTLVTYGDFDVKMLNQVCARHGLEPITPSRHVNLMTIYAKYHGESGFAPGDYKWQTLENAYTQLTDKPLVGAHDALVDALALQTIVIKMQAFTQESEA